MSGLVQSKCSTFEGKFGDSVLVKNEEEEEDKVLDYEFDLFQLKSQQQEQEQEQELADDRNDIFLNDSFFQRELEECFGLLTNDKNNLSIGETIVQQQLQQVELSMYDQKSQSTNDNNEIVNSDSENRNNDNHDDQIVLSIVSFVQQFDTQS